MDSMDSDIKLHNTASTETTSYTKFHEQRQQAVDKISWRQEATLLYMGKDKEQYNSARA